LVVYTPSLTESQADQMIRDLAGTVPPSTAQKLRQKLMTMTVYTKMLRCELIDTEKRLFAIQRWCVRGSIDDWIYLGGPPPLANLIEKYAKHLGRDSFYDLI
jgi:hypothetical protein